MLEQVTCKGSLQADLPGYLQYLHFAVVNTTVIFSWDHTSTVCTRLRLVPDHVMLYAKEGQALSVSDSSESLPHSSLLPPLLSSLPLGCWPHQAASCCCRAWSPPSSGLHGVQPEPTCGWTALPYDFQVRGWGVFSWCDEEGTPYCDLWDVLDFALDSMLEVDVFSWWVVGVATVMTHQLMVG